MQSEVSQRVTPDAPVNSEGGDIRVLLVDVGADNGIVDCLRTHGASVVRSPWHDSLHTRSAEVDAVLLGDGPGDPSSWDALAAEVRELLAVFQGPIFGIGLG